MIHIGLTNPRDPRMVSWNLNDGHAFRFGDEGHPLNSSSENMTVEILGQTLGLKEPV